jgi:hypothetical protein
VISVMRSPLGYVPLSVEHKRMSSRRASPANSWQAYASDISPARHRYSAREYQPQTGFNQDCKFRGEGIWKSAGIIQLMLCVNEQSSF